MSKQKTAAMIVIGDEILSGRTTDKNVPYLAKRCDEIGIALSEVRFIADIESEIVEAVNALRKKCDYVFTTGGIGPTHDDITAASIAKAFNVEFERNPGALEQLEAYYPPEELNDTRKTMADMPVGVTLIPNPVTGAPGFIIENVHVMAGIPEIMQAMFEHFATTFCSDQKILSETVTCNLVEGIIGSELKAIQTKYDNVKIGSYPYFLNDSKGVSVVMRSHKKEPLSNAKQDVIAMIEALNGSIVDIGR